MALAISLTVLFSLQVISCKKEVAAPNQQFIGVWTGTTNCGGTPYADQWSITATNSTTGITLVSTGGNTIGSSVRGTVSGNAIIIASQYDVVDSVTIYGSGALSSNQLSITISDNLGDNCTFTGTK